MLHHPEKHIGIAFKKLFQLVHFLIIRSFDAKLRHENIQSYPNTGHRDNDRVPWARNLRIEFKMQHIFEYKKGKHILVGSAQVKRSSFCLLPLS